MAPQLLMTEQSFDPKRYLPSDYLETLRIWDREPTLLPGALAETPPRRLGFYFERLYESLLTDLLGWEILLKNQQVQAQGRTVGELDFVVLNKSDNQIEHHEIAVKFYLGVPDQDGPDRWHGPNAKDRLDLKTTRLLDHQSQLTHRPEARHLLAQHGIKDPLVSRVFMPGYLFYPDARAADISVPPTTPANHLRGTWYYATQLGQTDIARCVPLHKPHWIGPWTQDTEPDAAASQAALLAVTRHKVPTLFAEMGQEQKLGIWAEQRRFFVVPDTWPGIN